LYDSKGKREKGKISIKIAAFRLLSIALMILDFRVLIYDRFSARSVWRLAVNGTGTYGM
jgi:hypothetical protein